MALIIIIIILLVVIAAVLAYLFSEKKDGKKTKRYDLTRNQKNPLISPSTQKSWEAQATLNPAAVKDDEGNVHMFYRAIGNDGISRIGYAKSKDGTHLDDVSPYPVYQPMLGFGLPDPVHVPIVPKYDPLVNASGGSWAGCEDPRAVIIGDRVYMTYTSFGGWNDMRIALTSITVKDLKKKRWNWKNPMMISPPGARSKNWVLFPEKINGKFAIMHGITPHIRIEYLDSLDEFYGDKYIKSSPDHGGQGYQDATRKGYWDNWVRGIGAPPLRTDIGWLVLYHSIDKSHPEHVIGYKVGAMILDVKDPTKILYRAPTSILTPEMNYEKSSKEVVYASGAVIKDGKLLVYYGGGDKHICVAETPLQPLLDWLVKYGKV